MQLRLLPPLARDVTQLDVGGRLNRAATVREWGANAISRSLTVAALFGFLARLT
jgi:hypothetical protein